MALELHASTAAQISEIAGILCDAFNMPRGSGFADARLLQWKYFDAAALWDRPCSYLMTRADALAAHCAVMPIRLRVDDRDPIDGVCFVDWASARQTPYAGLLLKKRLMSDSELAIVTGGTDATRALIPKLGFRTLAAVETYARVIRPLTQWRTRPHVRLWKDTARLVRNTAWSLAAGRNVSRDWKAERVDRFTETTCTVTVTMTLPEHKTDLLNYWLRCPSVKVEGYQITKSGARCGHFLLSRVRGQARIADLRLSSGDMRDWEMAYRLATQTAAEDSMTCEVTALSAAPFSSAALASSGFRCRYTVPLSVYDPQRRLSSAPPLLWSYIDNDAAYLYDPSSPYST